MAGREEDREALTKRLTVGDGAWGASQSDALMDNGSGRTGVVNLHSEKSLDQTNKS